MSCTLLLLQVMKEPNQNILAFIQASTQATITCKSNRCAVISTILSQAMKVA
jgi:hypothetical protein